MSERDSAELDVLRAARRALSPDNGDAMRVLARTQVALEAASPSQDAAGGPSESVLAPLESGPFGYSWVRAVTALAAVAVAAGGVGYAVGHRHGRTHQVESPDTTRRWVPPSAPGTAQVVPQGGDPPVVADSGRNPAAGSPVRKPRERVPTVTPPSSSSSAADQREGHAPPTWDDELRTLRRVERSLREANPRLALALLRELDGLVPRGKMMEERRAAATIAQCQLGVESGEQLAGSFETSHGRSMYVERVNEACGVTRATKK